MCWSALHSSLKTFQDCSIVKPDLFLPRVIFHRISKNIWCVLFIILGKNLLHRKWKHDNISPKNHSIVIFQFITHDRISNSKSPSIRKLSMPWKWNLTRDFFPTSRNLCDEPTVMTIWFLSSRYIRSKIDYMRPIIILVA